MNEKNEMTRKLALAGILAAIGVIGGTLSVPVGFTRCCPTQSVINVIGAIFLGPVYNLCVAFVIALLRNILGTGTIMAFPGSVCGALLAGLLYKYRSRLYMACLGECIGTGIISAILAYPIATLILGRECGVFTYVIPFMTAAVTGVVLATLIVMLLDRSGALRAMSRMASGE